MYRLLLVISVLIGAASMGCAQDSGRPLKPIGGGCDGCESMF